MCAKKTRHVFPSDGAAGRHNAHSTAEYEDYYRKKWSNGDLLGDDRNIHDW